MRRYQADLKTLFPMIAVEWHPTKNGDLTPCDVTPGSQKNVWWKCAKGPDHEWQADICNRTGRKSGCPCCAGKKASVTNSLASLYPDVAKQWHPKKNGKITPDQVPAGSSKELWWKCPKGPDHEWTARVYQRTQRGVGCPFCSGHRVSEGKSLAVMFPVIAQRWHPSKNRHLTPDQVAPFSNKKVWWKCPKADDHEWRATVASQAGGGGCPYCSGNRVTASNSFAALDPEVAAEWHPAKNGNLTPSQVRSGSGISVWWKCQKGPDHEWRAKICSRTTPSSRAGCPFCAGISASVTNSLASIHPRLAEEWHPTKNREVTPDQVPSGSNKKYWWKCLEGPDHEWDASPSARTSKPRKGGGKGRGCPFCVNQRVSVTNSLLSLFPEVAQEWHTEKNKGLTPDRVIAGSGRKFWWRCKHNPEHEWRATPSDRRGPRRSGCPYCRLRPRSKAETYLAFELAYFLGFDVDRHKLRIGDVVWDADFIVPNLRLVIEFDGSFWHRHRQGLDRKKTRMLTDAGWTVIRLREKPLTVLAKNDIEVPQALTEETIKQIAALALRKVEEVTGTKINKRRWYERRNALVNWEQAESYIDRTLESRRGGSLG